MNRIFYIGTTLLALSVFALQSATAQLPKKVTEIEGITEYKLDNGIQLLLFPDDSKPQFTVNMTLMVGSRHEGYGETGMAHLLEHMLFRGTEKYPDTPKWLKEKGVLNMNGTTWLDRTNYYETLPASEENLEFALDMESDRLLNSTILAEHLAAEMTIVRNEFERGENSPQRILMQRIAANAFEWHNYGKSTIGNRSDIERVPISNLREFYRKFYQPDNLMLVIAGKFDQDKALELVEKYFGSLKIPDRKLPKTYTEEPVQDGERLVVLKRNGDVQMAGAAYHVPAASSDDYAAVEVLVNILGDEPSGPLYKKLVKTELATSASTMAFKTHDPGLFYVFAEVSKDKDLEKAKTVMLETVQNAADDITEADVQRALRGIEKRRERQFANSESFAIELSEWRSYGDWRMYFLHRDRLEKVTLADVKAAAKAYLKTDNRTVGLFIPTKDPDRTTIPERVDIAKKLEGYKGRKAMAKGEAFDPTPANIDARTEIVKIADGVQVAMLPKKVRGGRVVLSGTMHFGTEDSLKGHVTHNRILGRLMGRGTKQLSFQEYQDKLDEIETSLNVSGDTGQLSFSVETKAERVGEALDLLKEVLQEPALDADEMEVLRNEGLTALESTLSDPQALGVNAMQRAMSPYPADDVRYEKTIEESIEAMKNVKVEGVRAFYEQFVGGQNVEIGVVGQFDSDVVQEKLAAIFTDWSTQEAYERIATPAPNVEGQRITINTPDKKNALYIGALPLAVDDQDENYEAMLIGNYILGGGPLSSRLADRVRKKEGLSYGVGSQFVAGSQDKSGAFIVFAISNPDNSEKVVSTIAEEINRIIESGVESKEMRKARKSFLRTRKGRRANDNALAQTLRENLELGRTMEFAQQGDEAIEALTEEQVEAAIKALITPEKMVVVTAGDFEKKSESESEAEQKTEVKAEAEAEPAGSK
ncbi:M16 family metallopeptidase [Mariniblastus fucicola]|uniref:Protease 3 n=1 Tax=Mariniblastus fucicola TaxID=980251 RepID=A0A5B9P506_9BACT|nr:pitrilysin family protein [Mariniblastus fucicola]QEG21687.1 Protease 3 precursor [Mariniblastus fucicola]